MHRSEEKRAVRILSLDGGGYLGLAGAAFLAELERHFGVSCHDSFDLFLWDEHRRDHCSRPRIWEERP